MNLLPTKRLAFAKVVEEYDIESGIIDIIIHHVNEIWRALPIAYKQFAEWKWSENITGSNDLNIELHVESHLRSNFLYKNPGLTYILAPGTKYVSETITWEKLIVGEELKVFQRDNDNLQHWLRFGWNDVDEIHYNEWSGNDLYYKIKQINITNGNENSFPFFDFNVYCTIFGYKPGEDEMKDLSDERERFRLRFLNNEWSVQYWGDIKDYEDDDEEERF